MKILNQKRGVVFVLCCFIFSFSAGAAEEKFPSWNVDDCRDNKIIQRIYDDIELYQRAARDFGATEYSELPREDDQHNEMRRQHYLGLVSIIYTQGYILALLCDNLLRLDALEDDK